MVVYPNESDIPPSPREPSDPLSGETIKEESFGDPVAKVKVICTVCLHKVRSNKGVKDREALYNAQRNTQPPLTTPPVPDLNNLLRIMQNQSQSLAQLPPQQPLQPVAATNPSSGLESIFAQFAKSNAQQAPPMQQPAQQPTPGFNLQAALASLNPGPPQPGYGAPNPVPNLGAIIAQMGNPSAPQAPPLQGYRYGNQYQNDNDRKRQYEPDDGDYGRKKQRGGGLDKLPYKTKVCKYWQEGRCRRGDECSYLHE